MEKALEIIELNKLYRNKVIYMYMSRFFEIEREMQKLLIYVL